MEINLELYKVFASVASNGSLSKAAEELSVTQSAVSQQIGKLEKIFNKQLFVRSRGGVQLTSFGSKLFEEIKPVIERLDGIYEKVNSAPKSKTIKIGASGTIANRFILPVIAKYFQNENIYIESLLSDKEKIVAVETGALDFAVINDYNLPLSSSLYKKNLLLLDYGFFYNSNLISPNKENIFDQTLIIKNGGTKGRVEFNKKFYSTAFKFKRLIELSHDDTILSATKMGLGIGFLPVQYADGLAQFSLEGERVVKSVVAIYQQHNEFIDKLAEELSKL